MITDEQKQLMQKMVDEQLTTIKQAHEAEIRSLKADLLHLQTKNDQARRDSSVGRCAMHNTTLSKTALSDQNSISAEEYAAVLPAKLELHSLEEVVFYDAVSHGIDPRNDAEFLAFLGVEGYRPSLATLAKRLG